MTTRTPEARKRVAVIGAGIAGVASADILQRCCFDVIVFERSQRPGGLWYSSAYADVEIQATTPNYAFSNYPWPRNTPTLRPKAPAIVEYVDAAVRALDLNVRCGIEVRSVEPDGEQWKVTVAPTGSAPGCSEEETHVFDHVVMCVGQQNELMKAKPQLPGQDTFKGRVVTERDVVGDPAATFAGKRVVVIGFGKSALEMVTLAAGHGASGPVAHVFRAVRWMIPRDVLGVLDVLELLFARHATMFIPSWVHPTKLEQLLHAKAPGLVKGFWWMIGALITASHRLDARAGFRAARAAGAGAQEQATCARNLDLVLSPKETLTAGMRCSLFVAPVKYCSYVASGHIVPHKAEVVRLEGSSVVLSDGSSVEADVVVAALGATATKFPFLPKDMREKLEADPDGVQLYRHVLLPGYPSIGFNGLNYTFMFVPTAEVAALWLGAVWSNQLRLPSVEKQQACVDYVKRWKREHMLFESTRISAVNARFQKYIDTLLLEVGVSPYRRQPNIISEMLLKYGASDYKNIVEEFKWAASRRGGEKLNSRSDLLT